MRNLTSKVKPVIAISLTDDQKDEFVPSYTSLDQIRGHVTITAKYDTSFDEIYVTFEGTAKTFVEKIATASPANGRTEAFQVFLRLVQPMDPRALPESDVLKAGQTYKFPFTFVVPEKLLPQSCTHARGGHRMQEVHLNLPPSLGDPMTASVGKTLLDDMAPEMAVVSYAVKARVIQGRGTSGKPVIAAESSKKLRIVPAVEELPPITVHGGLKDDYRLRKEKEIKKGIFKGKLGCLTMESSQPRSLRLPPLRSTSSCSVTTMATVNVRFDPADESAQPPALSSLSTKLKVATYFASVPMNDIPTKITDFHYSNTKGVLVETIMLSSRCIASAPWERHSSHTTNRRDSAFSTLSNPVVPEPSSSYNGKTYYTTQILVPITLPKGSKVFVPTFYSCLVSRVYSLDIYLSISAMVTAPSMHIKVPIQVSMEGNPDARPSISAQEAQAIAAREANDIFSPRHVTPPTPEYIGQANLGGLPSPEYSELEQNNARGPPSPDYAEYAQPVRPAMTQIYEDSESISPPVYSSFSQRNGRVRTEMMMPLGTPPIRY